MKKFYFLLAVLPLLYSCYQEYEELDSFLNEKVDQINTRTTGDEKYDVLGYGYDITDEYLGENAVKLQVINVQAFVNDGDNKYRFDNPFIGIIEQNCYAGENAYSFLEDIRTKTDFSGSVASLIDVKKDGFFSGTVSTKFESDKKYSFSTKFSYAKAEVIKKQRRYLLNTDINSLSKYLTPSFLSDIQKYSADKIVLKYGTHVLTNFTVGGKYTGLYKSAIVEENNHTEKTKTVSAGAKANFSGIGLDANGSWSTTSIQESNTKNSNWQLFIKSYGGSTSGTSMTISSTPTFTINLGEWTNSVDDAHSVLISVNWNATYPIYDLVEDPVKKEQLKTAVINYINSKSVEVLEIVPFYRYWGNGEHYFAQEYAPKLWYDQYTYEQVACYLLAKQQNGSVPLNRYWGDGEHYYTLDLTPTLLNGKYKLEGVVGYIYRNQVPGTVPLYVYWGNGEHHYDLQYAPKLWYGQYKYEGITGYVYPIND